MSKYISIDYKKVVEDWHKLKNDKERWQWLIDNQDTGVILYLDNDDTFASFDESLEDIDDLTSSLRFDGYVWGPGFPTLLNFLNIRHEAV